MRISRLACLLALAAVAAPAGAQVRAGGAKGRSAIARKHLVRTAAEQPPPFFLAKPPGAPDTPFFLARPDRAEPAPGKAIPWFLVKPGKEAGIPGYLARPAGEPAIPWYLSEPVPVPPALLPPESRAPLEWQLPGGGIDRKEIAAALAQPEPRPAETQPIPAAARPPVLVKTILGLIALLALAYLGGHPQMRVVEQRLKISQVVTAGFPFIALGVVASLPGVGILTASVLEELTPILRFGLGWIGFAAGYRFDTRAFDDLPKDTARAVGFATLMPFLTVLTAASLLLLLASDWTDTTFRDPIFLRDALILGTAGAMTARAAIHLAKGNGGEDGWQRRFVKIVQLEQLAGIAGLAFIAAYFRPQGPGLGWQLPGTAWIFLTVGLGATIGIVAYVILRRPATGAESVVLLLGTVAFAAGAASALFLSPIVVCFVAGVLLANFPGASKDRLGGALEKLERPIYLLFLVVVGAIWNFSDWRGWVLLVIFVGARLAGKWLGALLTSRYTEFDSYAHERWVATRAPMGQLAIAIVISAQLLFPHGSIPIVVTAVIGGAIVTEVLVQIFARSPRGGVVNPFDDDLVLEIDPQTEDAGAGDGATGTAPALPPEVA
ncbi:MAG TPA: hypothetical protein VGD74_09340 [Vulgatibacter sp.]